MQAARAPDSRSAACGAQLAPVPRRQNRPWSASPSTSSGGCSCAPGKILEAERVPKSNKLVRMVVDFGDEKRQIVGGIGKKYAPEQLVGRTCPFVTNLQPAKLMGVESDGMVMAGNLDGEPILLQFVEDVPPGSKIT